MIFSVVYIVLGKLLIVDLCFDVNNDNFSLVSRVTVDHFLQSMHSIEHKLIVGHLI